MFLSRVGWSGFEDQRRKSLLHVGRDPPVTMALSKLVLDKEVPTSPSFHVLPSPPFSTQLCGSFSEHAGEDWGAMLSLLVGRKFT